MEFTETHKRVRKQLWQYDRRRMNYYGPRQRLADSRWEYTVQNDELVYSVGYCTGWIERTVRDFHFFLNDVFVTEALKEQETRRQFVAKYHTDGHEHAVDACMCYKLYLLDNSLHLNVGMYETVKPCVVCKAPTNMCAEIDIHNLFVLCDAHRTKETVHELYLRPEVMTICRS